MLNSDSKAEKVATYIVPKEKGTDADSLTQGSHSPTSTAEMPSSRKVDHVGRSPVSEKDNSLTQKGAHDVSANTLPPGEEEGIEYPDGIKLGLITLALCLSVFLIALVRLTGCS